jgi:2,4-dienoyl-CoA reductase-like NADH-dependent reductase (Old Yellow Enzyme family)
VANAKSTGHPSLAPTRRFNPLSMRFDHVATEADIHRIVGAHADAAEMARDVGFDCVEVHFGHGYLVSSFLSPSLNRRRDSWGGSLENRSRFARLILDAIRDRVGDSIAVIAKINMTDGVAGGVWLDESIPFAQMLEADGHLDALELTGGSSLQNPMYLFRGDIPMRQLAAAQPPLLRAGMKYFGKAVFRSYPYEPMYFREYARQFRGALTMPLILLGGITDRPAMDTAMNDGFEFVAMARALLREPDLLKKMAVDRNRESLCIHCNRCMASVFTKTYCPLVVNQDSKG